MQRMRAGDSYSLLLAAIVFAYGMMAVLDDVQWHRTIEGAVFGGVLLLALHTSHLRGRWIRVAAIVVVVWIVFNVAQSIVGRGRSTARGTRCRCSSRSRRSWC